MASQVIDASALAALLFGEPAAEEVASRIRGNDLIAPPILSYEVASVCLKKMRSHPQQRKLLLEAFSLRDMVPVREVDVVPGELLRIAEETGLTVYDAAYVWLAESLGAELVTLDKVVIRAATRRGVECASS